VSLDASDNYLVSTPAYDFCSELYTSWLSKNNALIRARLRLLYYYRTGYVLVGF
jgi:hypothetical protein